MRVAELTVLSLLIVFTACATPKETTPELKIPVLNKEFETGFEKIQSLPPSVINGAPVQKGQWVKWAVHYKSKLFPPRIYTLKVLSIKKGRVEFELETQTSENLEGKKVRFHVKGFPSSINLGMTKIERAKVARKMRIENIQKSDINEVFSRIFFLGYRVGELSFEKCQSQYLKSSQCVSFKYQIDRVRRKTMGHALFHSKIPILGLFETEDEISVTRVIRYSN